MTQSDLENKSQQASSENVLKRNFLHLSDLHFGRVDHEVLESLQSFIKSRHSKIDHVLISGDLTQRARPWQFIKAAEFIKNLQLPVIAIPGNHDVPLYHLLNRFFRPVLHYHQYMTPVVSDHYEDDHVVICSFHSHNIYSIASGKFRDTEVERVVQALERGRSKFKVVVCHHPLFDRLARDPVIAKKQMEILNGQPHLIVSGHRHEASVRYFDESKTGFPLLVSGGTSASDRTRNEGNTLNLISVHDYRVQIDTFAYHREKKEFVLEKSFNHDHSHSS